MDVPKSRKFPKEISFRNENGEMTRVMVHYEWRRTVCANCRMVGHMSTECRLGNTKRVWVRKQPSVAHTESAATKFVLVENDSNLDTEGFQISLRPIRVRPSLVIPTRTINAFQILGIEGQTERRGEIGANGDIDRDHGRNAAGREDSSHPNR